MVNVTSAYYAALAANATMRAVVGEGNAFNVSVVDWPIPKITNQTDAIVRMSRAGICGSDLHIVRGTQQGNPPPYILGHEGIGYVAAVGEGVNHLHVGDAVIVPFAVDEGHVETSLTSTLYASYGTGGELGGTQDNGLVPVPSFTLNNRSIANDFVMLSDIFPTGWAALDFAGFKPGDIVAIFGAGPVGLQAAHSAHVRGASKVYSVDYVPERLRAAESLGAIPINFVESDPVQQILSLEPNGVTRSIDAVGYEQVNRNLTTDSHVIIQNMLAVTAPGGGLGTVGVYTSTGNNTETAPRASTVQGPAPLSLATFFGSELSWQAGPSDPIGLAPEQLALILSGRVSPGRIVSEEIGIEEAVDAYRRFERRETTKVVIVFDEV